MSSLPIPCWLPNAISCLRVLMVPAWLWFAEAANRSGEAGGDPVPLRLSAALVLIAIGISDVVDGWLARKYELQSRFGANLDAIADKLAQVALTTYLALRVGPAFPWLPYWFLGLLIARDALLALGFLIIRRQRGSVEAQHVWHGKAASVGLFLVLVLASFGVRGPGILVLQMLTTTMVVASTVAYSRHGLRQLAAMPSS